MATTRNSDGSETVTDGADRARSRNLRPLRDLLPFLKPYRGMLLAALAALLLAASATLSLPVAVRFMIDEGFSTENATKVDRYFLAMFGIASLLAISTSLRYYLVSWLGERVVADVREAVFSHILRLSQSFYETTRTGEVLSRLTTDTTILQSVVGSSASIALRNILLLAGGLVMLGVTSPKLTGLIVVLVPVMLLPLILFGRRVRARCRAATRTASRTPARSPRRSSPRCASCRPTCARPGRRRASAAPSRTPSSPRWRASAPAPCSPRW
jgi:ATP-binding cassette, subfamily B, bacterial